MNYQSSITLFYSSYTNAMAKWVRELGNAYIIASSFVVRIDFKSAEDLVTFKLKFGV